MGLLVGFGHKKQVGKNTAALILKALFIWDNKFKQTVLFSSRKDFIKHYIDSYYYTIFYDKVKLVSFADKLKIIATELTSTPIELWESGEFKDSKCQLINTITNRELLQKIGQGFREILDPDIWVKTLFSSYKESDNWLITDVRMPNEAKAIKDRNGILIKINRNTGYNDNHISETALDGYSDWDYIISNDGSLDDLINEITVIYNNIIK